MAGDNPKLGPPVDAHEQTPIGQRQQQHGAAATMGTEDEQGGAPAAPLAAINNELVPAAVSIPLLAASLAAAQQQAQTIPFGASTRGAPMSTLPAGLSALVAGAAPTVPSHVLRLQSNFAQQQPQPFLNANLQQKLDPSMPTVLKRPLEKERLRAGKWSPEEEEYALVLIDLFGKGLVSDCENGTTLRAYLSTKLECAPMRISKKFAGKGIGKMIYVRRKQCPRDLEAKKKAAEQKFRQAIHSVADYFVRGMKTSAQAALMGGMMQPPPPPPGFPVSAATATASFPIPMTTKSMTSSHTKQLHESYIRALQQTVAKQVAAANGSTALAPTNAVAPNVVGVPAKAAATATGHLASILPKVIPSVVPSPNSGGKPSVDKALLSLLPKKPKEDKESKVLSQAIKDSLPENANKFSKPATTSPTIYDQTALFTAESYALFAQESAIEASQHAAYLLQDPGVPKYQKHQKDFNTDVDGMLKMVSEHTFGIPLKLPARTPGKGGEVPAAPGLPNVEHDKRTTTSELTPVERFVASHGRGSALAPNVVSDTSNYATESSMSAFGPTTSESNGSDQTSNDSDESQSEEDCHSTDAPLPPPRKKVKLVVACEQPGGKVRS